MITYVHFITGLHGAWLGTLQYDCHPAGVAATDSGRLVLTATNLDTFRDAVEDLLAAWEDDGHNAAVYPRYRDDLPPIDADYVYAFGGAQVWLWQPNHIWTPAIDHPDVKAALGHN